MPVTTDSSAKKRVSVGVDTLLEQLTLADKIALLSGKGESSVFGLVRAVLAY